MQTVTLKKGELAAFMDNSSRHALFTRTIHEAGSPLVRLSGFGGLLSIVLIADGPTMKAAAATLSKGPMGGAIHALTHKAVIVLTGKPHRAVRSLMDHAFHTTALRTYTQTIDTRIQSSLEDYSHRESISPHEMNVLARQIAMGTIFGDTKLSIADEEMLVQFLQETFRGMIKRMAIPSELIPEDRLYRELRKEVYQRIISIIRDRMKNDELGADVLGLLIRENEVRRILTIREVAGNAITAFSAAHDTTTSAAMSSLYRQAIHHDKVTRMAAEAANTLPASSDQLTFEQAYALEYAGWFGAEVVRVHTPSWMIPRQAGIWSVVAGTRLPPYCLVFLLPGIAQTWEPIWPQALEFRPERFAPDEKDAFPKDWYMPFGSGPSSCIGSELEKLILKLLNARAAEGYAITVANMPVPFEEYTGTMQPSSALRLTVTRRN